MLLGSNNNNKKKRYATKEYPYIKTNSKKKKIRDNGQVNYRLKMVTIPYISHSSTFLVEQVSFLVSTCKLAFITPDALYAKIIFEDKLYPGIVSTNWFG